MGSTPESGQAPADNQKPQLHSEHIQVLKDRAIPVEYAVRLGLRSVDLREWKRLRERHGTTGEPYNHLPLHETTGLLIPYPAALDDIARCRVRVDKTEIRVPGPVEGQEDVGATTTKIGRYLAQAETSVIPFWTPEALAIAADVSRPLFGAEAPLKAMALSCSGFPAFGMGGVLAGAHDPKELKVTGQITACAEFRRINWTGRRCYVVYDATVYDPKKPLVSLGAAYLAMAVKSAGGAPWLVRIPPHHRTEDDVERGQWFRVEDQGPDDFIARHGVAAFRACVEAAEPFDPCERLACVYANYKGAERATRAAKLLEDLPALAYLHAAGASAVAAFIATAKTAGVGAREIRAAVQEYKARLVPTDKETAPEWTSDLKLTGNGLPEPSLRNGLLILRHDKRIKDVLALDELVGAPVLTAEPPWAPGKYVPGRELTDEDVVRLAVWLDEAHGLKLSTKTLHELVDASAAERAFHPVRRWLEGLTWDGTERLSTWMESILGAEDSSYTRTISRKSILQMVARAYTPGCLAKSVVVLEAPQNQKKSTIVRELVGEQWWTDQLPADLGDKDASQNLRGVWGIELPELASKKRSDLDTVKAYISRLFDRYRPSYGRRTIKVLRSCTFWGTTNQQTYLVDSTGNVRWWPVRVGVTHTIDVDKLKAEREQIFAEAVVAFKANEPWWFTTAQETAEAAAATESRRHPDPWESPVTAYLDGKTEISIFELLSDCLKIDPKGMTRGDEMRMASVLEAVGWGKPVGDHRKEVGEVERRVYMPTANAVKVERKEPAALTAAEEQAGRTLQLHGWTLTVGGDGRRTWTEPTERVRNVVQLLENV